MPESLCTFCVNPAACALCALMLSPERLTTRKIAQIARAMPARRAPQAPAAWAPLPAAVPPPPPSITAPVAPELPKAPAPAPLPPSPDLVRQLEAARAKNAALRARANLPPAPPAPKAPAVDLSAPLAPNDWIGLGARVEAGKLTQQEAEKIGAAWLASRPVASA